MNRLVIWLVWVGIFGYVIASVSTLGWLTLNLLEWLWNL